MNKEKNFNLSGIIRRSVISRGRSAEKKIKIKFDIL